MSPNSDDEVKPKPKNCFRKVGVPSFIHIDYGLGFQATKEEARVAVDMVKKDLDDFGLVTSQDKCRGSLSRSSSGVGLYGTSRTSEKRERNKSIARELLRKELMTAKEMAGLTGLIILCSPAVGRCARFYTRFGVIWCHER